MSKRVHVFRVKELGYEENRFSIDFDASKYSKEEAEAQFKPYEAISQRGYKYKAYEYDGHKYYSFEYLGEHDEDKAPRNDADLLAYNLRKK